MTTAFRRVPLLLALTLGLLAAPVHGQSLLPDENILNTLPIELPKNFKFNIPPRPEGHVQDTANFLMPEMRQSIETMLAQEAKDHGVHIYVLTVPSIPKGGFELFTEKVAAAWTNGLFAATLVFDDGTGHVALQPSDEVRKRFYEFELSQLLKETMNADKRRRLSREALEHTARSVLTSMHELKMRANREDRDSLFTRIGLGVLIALGLGVGASAYLRSRQAVAAEPAPDEEAEEARPTDIPR